MSGTHPSEETLQQYVLDRSACTRDDIAHIGVCPDCQAAVAAYGLLTDALAGQPVPAFAFDLVAAVMERVEAARTPDRKSSTAGIWVLIALVIGVPAWLFRRSAYFVFTDMSAGFYWVLLAAAGVVVALFLLRLHKKYQDVINIINK
jgi:anti-sigma factor RsiW